MKCTMHDRQILEMSAGLPVDMKQSRNVRRWQTTCRGQRCIDRRRQTKIIGLTRSTDVRDKFPGQNRPTPMETNRNNYSQNTKCIYLNAIYIRYYYCY